MISRIRLLDCGNALVILPFGESGNVIPHRQGILFYVGAQGFLLRFL